MNRTRLECKGIRVSITIWKSQNDLNRTRLECKVAKEVAAQRELLIWIEPDWNVKINWTTIPDGADGFE